MTDRDTVKQLYKKSISMITGIYSNIDPLGGTKVSPENGNEIQSSITLMFEKILKNEKHNNCQDLESMLGRKAEQAEEIFTRYYLKEKNKDTALKALTALENRGTANEKAKIIAEIWTPELKMTDDEIVSRWKLHNVNKNPDPIKPVQITLQLNALYTLPDRIPKNLDTKLKSKWTEIENNTGVKIADYDHPVPLFESNENHELVNCLKELDRDIDFEKSKGVFPQDHKLLITLSISVTHTGLDQITGMWINSILKQSRFLHLSFLVLTESSINLIKDKLFGKDIPVFSVSGKYAAHFNALKYTQLLLEKAYSIKAGFKLDTDEGIKSKDLWEATGKTWFQTLCHEFWGGTAHDCKDRFFYLDFNEGEYINNKDINRLGYKDSMRSPDVSIPSSYIGPEIFFNKGFAHGRSTSLYNKFNSLNDYISHPVVKGGGYGITNNGLRRAVPFTYSQVGRAEDQQFYFCGLKTGIRGIFHPNLRIAHYKNSVAKSEGKTAASRFLGDMYRLVIFQQIVKILEVKEDIDPMPGIFAGDLARAQAFLNLTYRAYIFSKTGKEEEAKTLIFEGLNELEILQTKIDSGDVLKEWNTEKAQWLDFIKTADSIDAKGVRSILDGMVF